MFTWVNSQWKFQGIPGHFSTEINSPPEIDEERIKELHAKIGELAVANDFLSRKLKPWGVK